MSGQRLVSDLGNLFVAGSVGAVVLVWTGLRLNRLVAATFGVAFVGVVLAAAGLKLVSRHYLAEPGLTSTLMLSRGAPSGHAAITTLVYGCAAVIFLRAGKGGLAALGFLGALVAIAGVGITRVTLQAHTLSDVLCGLMLGLLGVWAFSRALKAQVGDRKVAILGLGLAMAAAALLALLSGLRISSDQFL
ncbi:hypothetical protein BH10PSE4_BH10PSE4_07030 [soil metagenome]